MPDYIVCTRAIKGGSFSSEPGPTRFLKVPDKRTPDPSHEINRTSFITDLVGTPKAQKCEDLVVFVDGWYFYDPLFLKDLTFTLAGDMDREVIPIRTNRPYLNLVIQ